MNYIAHCDGEREQSILEHLQGTAEKAKDFAEVFEKGDWGYCCGMLHDIGKYSEEFQRKIQEDTNDRVDHATAGAQVCKERGGYYSILSYCIAGHHAGLPDYGNTAMSSSLCGRWKKRICDYHAYKDEIKIPKLDTDPIVFSKDEKYGLCSGNIYPNAVFVSCGCRFSGYGIIHEKWRYRKKIRENPWKPCKTDWKNASLNG